MVKLPDAVDSETAVGLSGIERSNERGNREKADPVLIRKGIRLCPILALIVSGSPTDTAATNCLSSLKVEMSEQERMRERKGEKRVGY